MTNFDGLPEDKNGLLSVCESMKDHSVVGFFAVGERARPKKLRGLKEFP